MTFQFDTFAEFLAMPGKSLDHGPFVWAAYAVTIVAILALVRFNRSRRRDIIKKIQMARLHEQQLKEE